MSRWLSSLFMILVLAPVASAEWKAWTVAAVDQVRSSDRGAIVLVGYGTCQRCDEITNEVDPGALPALMLDAAAQPETAEAYRRFAEIMLERPVNPPILVRITPTLDPIAAIDEAEPGTARALIESTDAIDLAEAVRDAARRVRIAVLEGSNPSRRDTPGPELSRIYAELLDGRETDADFERLRILASTAVYDQMGGGFHRGPRDDSWSTPHFEKLLTDQAYAVLAYTAAWQKTDEPRFQEVARQTANMMLREMRDESGHFFGALGSHSLVPRGEPVWSDGGHYVWTSAEVRHLLGEAAEGFLAYYQFRDEGNVPEVLDPAGDLAGRNVLRPRPEAAEPSPELRASLAKLLEVRENRPPPQLNRSVHTGANALAVSALARAGAALEEPRYRAAAEETVRSLIGLRRDPDGRLLTAERDEASLRDHLLLIRALLDVWESSFAPEAFGYAVELERYVLARFRDEENATWRGQAFVPEMLVNLVSATELDRMAGADLLRMGVAVRDDAWTRLGHELLGTDAPWRLVVVAGDRSQRWSEMLRVVRSGLRPRVSLYSVHPGNRTETLALKLPVIAAAPECVEGRRHGVLVGEGGEQECVTAAIICGAESCGSPTIDPAVLRNRLD